MTIKAFFQSYRGAIAGGGLSGSATSGGAAGLWMAEGGPGPYGIGMSASTLEALPKVGAPATRALNAAGYTTLKELAGVSRAELSKLHGVGPKALHVIEEAL